MRTESRRSGSGLLAMAGVAVLLFSFAAPAAAQGIGREQLKEMMAWGTGSLILFDKLEYIPDETLGRPVELDLIGWYGGAYNRLWFRGEGEQRTARKGGEGEAHVYYGRLVTPYWDALAGIRVDGHWGEDSGTRAHLALGVVGLAPMRFELSPTLFISQDGDLSARFEAEYQLLVTQRLVLEPELELNAALQSVPEWGIGSGLNDIELGLRLRYEIRREFAPYVGYAWTRRLGETADLARPEGGPASQGTFVAGLRVWR